MEKHLNIIKIDLKLVLIASLILSYLGGLLHVDAEDDVPWGPEFEHDIEMEFTPMDPRDYPGHNQCVCD